MIEALATFEEKEREKWLSSTIFPPTWHDAQGIEEETFPKQRSSFQSSNNHDKS
jgi:hypothetical protein